MQKQLLLSVLAACVSFAALAQAPQKINYQGVARNISGQPLANQTIGLRISILDSFATGTAKFVETHSVTTNPLGLYNVAIGGGNAVSGLLSNVDWGAGDKYIKVEADPTGGSNYSSLGTAQLLSVPYALYAGNAANSSTPGPAGPAGPAGPTGPAGSPGPPGMSAEEMWNPNLFAKTRSTSEVIPFATGEILYQYAGSPIKVGSDIWVYTKGHAMIHAHKSTDNGTTFTHIDTAINRNTAAWDISHVWDPIAVNDSPTIHMLFKGEPGNDHFSIGYATASTAAPETFTRQNGNNPVITYAQALADAGFTAAADVTPLELFRFDNKWCLVVGICDSATLRYWSFLYTSTNMTTWTKQCVLTRPSDKYPFVIPNSIIKINSVYYMTVTYMDAGAGGPNGFVKHLYTTSPDADTWKELPGRFLETQPAAVANPWDGLRVYVARYLKETDGEFLTPALIGSVWHVYYSGSRNISGNRYDRCGLAKITPYQYDIDTKSSTPNTKSFNTWTGQQEFQVPMVLPDEGVGGTFNINGNYNVLVRLTQYPFLMYQVTPVGLADHIEKELAPVIVPVNTSMSPYSITATKNRHSVYLVDCSGGNVTVNFPTAVNNRATITVKKSDNSTNKVIMDGNGSETFDGNATADVTSRKTPLTVVSDNVNWQIISAY